MTAFAALFAALDATTATSTKVEAIAGYLTAAPPADAAWAVFVLTGRRFTRLVSGRTLLVWVREATGTPAWLFDECTSLVGDAAETAALLLDGLAATPAPPIPLAAWIEARILPLRDVPAPVQRERVLAWARQLPRWERFTFFKLLTGELRLGVSQPLVVRALTQVSGLPGPTVAARLMGDWQASADWYTGVVAVDAAPADTMRPYPFFLASPLGDGPQEGAGLAAALGNRALWQAEWKWDGIRAQLVRRDGRAVLWSRGEEVLTERFPEIVDAGRALPDGTVIDGEVLAWADDAPLPFGALQRRIGRTTQVARAARRVPVVFMAYDLLESGGEDCRALPLEVRRAQLEALVAALPVARAVEGVGAPAAETLLPFDDPAGAPGDARAVLRVSPRVGGDTWEALAAARAGARDRGVEGLMLKRLATAYGTGRTRGDWWKWKVVPHTVDAVLIYAEPGSGKRASLLTDYTFGLWQDGALVPVARAYSGLTDAEVGELDRWIRRHTVQRFGPVRHVEPVQVIELAFDGVARSARHRAGVAVRFPRMLRWRRDKPAGEADPLEVLHALADGR